jgi:predicted hydrocarbon binding protein
MSVMPSLERFSPQIMYQLLTATRRFEPDFYSFLCRKHHLDADRMLGLFGSVDELAAAQLADILPDLRQHSSYADIALLAGRNAALSMLEEAKVLRIGGGGMRFVQLVKEMSAPLLGRSTVQVLSRGAVQFVEIYGSVFAREAASLKPVCGFYTGFLHELGRMCSKDRVSVMEVRCQAAEPEAASCLFQVAL